VPIGLFQQHTGLNLMSLQPAIKQAQAKQLLIIQDGYMKPTLLGQRYLNELLTLFLNDE